MTSKMLKKIGCLFFALVLMINLCGYSSNGEYEESGADSNEAEPVCDEAAFYLQVKDESEELEDYVYGHHQEMETVFSLCSELDADEYQVEIAAENMEVISDTSFVLPGIQQSEIAVTYRSLDAGEGNIAVTVTAYADHHVLGTAKRTIYAYATEEQDYIDYNSQDNALCYYVYISNQNGTMSDREYVEWMKQLHRAVPVEKEMAAETEAYCGEVSYGLLNGTSTLTAGQRDLTVNGRVTWTDTDGISHEGKYLEGVVYLRKSIYSDGEGNIWDAYSFVTDGNGYYQAEFSLDSGFYYTIETVVYSRGSGVCVRDSGLLKHVYEQRTGIYTVGSEQTVFNMPFLDIDVANGAESIAFMTQQGAAEEAVFIKNVTGTSLEEVDVKYPTDEEASFYRQLTGIIHIDGSSGQSWDVIQHEYGHYVDDCYHITSLEGGAHYYDTDMLGDRDYLQEYDHTKEHVAKCAWSEGVATYLMAMTQEMMGDYYVEDVNCLEIQNEIDAESGENDDIYYKVNDSKYLTWYSTENGTDLLGTEDLKYGEFGEVAIGCFLYKFTMLVMENPNFESESSFRLLQKYQPVFDILSNLNAELFSDFANALSEKYADDFDMQLSLGTWYSFFKMSSKLGYMSDNYYALGQTDAKESSIRTFCWEAGEGSRACPNDSFYIGFYDEDGTDLWHSDGYIADTEFTLTLDNWSNILAYVDGGQIYWQISEKNTESPETVPYISQMGVIDTAEIDYGLDTPENLRNIYYTSSGTGAVLAPGMVSNAVPGVAWNAVPGAQKYYIYRSAQRNGNYTYWKSVTTTQVMDESASAGVTCYYKIRAVSETDISDLSAAKDTGLLAPKQSDPNVATVAAHRDAETMVLMLGGDLTTMQTNVNSLNAALVSPVFNVFGSPWNQEPCPQLWNYYYNLYAAEYAN